MDFSNILQGIATVITGLLAGSMLFFSFVMAPLIFIKLEIREAGKFVRAVFPWYYLVVIALSGLGGIALVAIAPLNASLLFLVTISAIYCRQSLMPSINDHRDRSNSGEEVANKIFNKLHRRSEVINGLQLLATMAVLLHISFVNFN
tara:strand:- start:36 stop:476 length:441 start_codon:yes stop_codon:yes gene_type:complete